MSGPPARGSLTAIWCGGAKHGSSEKQAGSQRVTSKKSMSDKFPPTNLPTTFCLVMALSVAFAPSTSVVTICRGGGILDTNGLTPVLIKPPPRFNFLTADSGSPCITTIGASEMVCGFTCSGSFAGRSSFAREVSISSLKMSRKYNHSHPKSWQIPLGGHLAATLGAMGEGEADISSSLEKSKSGDYTGNMQQAMGTTLTYRHDLGMNYNHVLPDLIVGSCPQTSADVDRLKTAGVGTIFCLQQDPDLAYFSVDISTIQHRAKELGSIEHIRAPIRDFDPYDLRLQLPKVLATLCKAMKRNAGTTTYIHCTAGLGRAPAVALTYMYWIRGYELAAANSLLQSVRPCHPKLDSIKGATVDVLVGNQTKALVLSWRGDVDYRVEIAGLDVGWYERIPLEKVEDGHWCVRRDVLVGEYEFKFIVDGEWKLSQDYPWSTPKKGQQVNNVINVAGDVEDAPIWELQKQIMADGFVLTDEHQSIIKERLEVLGEG